MEGREEDEEYHHRPRLHLVALAIAPTLLDLLLRRVRLFDRQLETARQRTGK
jgi:hypothetical protein